MLAVDLTAVTPSIKTTICYVRTRAILETSFTFINKKFGIKNNFIHQHESRKYRSYLI
jgi:hypothetical protein